MSFQSKEEAHAALEKARKELIEKAREIVVELCTSSRLGTTTTRQVRKEMERRGLLTPDFSEVWMGTLFRDKRFEWTGKVAAAEFEKTHFGRRTSGCAVKVWKLKNPPPDPRQLPLL